MLGRFALPKLFDRVTIRAETPIKIGEYLRRVLTIYYSGFATGCLPRLAEEAVTRLTAIQE
jgi:hypothetical protein